MTREEFVAKLEEGGATEEWLNSQGFEIKECDCGIDICAGWRVQYDAMRNAIEREKAARGVTAQPCPSCGRHIDSAGNRRGEVPEPGDISICINCSAVMEFTVEGPFRLLTQAEIETFPMDQQRNLARMLQEIELVRAIRGRPRFTRE